MNATIAISGVPRSFHDNDNGGPGNDDDDDDDDNNDDDDDDLCNLHE